MRHIKQFLFWFCLFLVSFSFAQSNKADTTRILFIGNSYTYFHSSPELLRSMIAQKHPEKIVEIQLISQGGMTLERHWQEEKTHQVIKSKNWDYVVLQEQSKLAMPIIIDHDVYFGQTDLFFDYSRKFDTEIKKVGAKTVFFMTWSVKQRPQEQEILTHAYASIAQELNAIVAPVGLVWEEVRKNDQFDLYENDGSHPSQYGSYLIATTMYATLFDEDPKGVSGTIEGKRLNSRGQASEEAQILAQLSNEDALKIQQSSWEITQNTANSKALQNVKEPHPTYRIPVLKEGEKLTQKNIQGSWYGRSTYGSNYVGLIMDISQKENNMSLSLSMLSPDRLDGMTIENIDLRDKELRFSMVDSTRALRSELQFSLTDGMLSGLSTSSQNNVSQYKRWQFSRNKVQNEIDLAALDQLIREFEQAREEKGYITASIEHYQKYSALIGKKYLPTENFLNREGYGLLRDGKNTDALEVFELANTLYPESVNTYDSFGEALAIDGQKEKAIAVFSKGYELAKKTGDPALNYIKNNLKKLQEEGTAVPEAISPIPPPPPPPQ
ncbi:DUF4886 domain-containing protein [Lutimonas sp.]|uniref:DUF4886 domain-containing protein n=1 Tax=Lutimonas sp. TaxID=1872403 RepID=UPI003D9B5489